MRRGKLLLAMTAIWGIWGCGVWPLGWGGRGPAVLPPLVLLVLLGGAVWREALPCGEWMDEWVGRVGAGVLCAGGPADTGMMMVRGRAGNGHLANHCSGPWAEAAIQAMKTACLAQRQGPWGHEWKRTIAM